MIRGGSIEDLRYVIIDRSNGKMNNLNKPCWRTEQCIQLRCSSARNNFPVSWNWKGSIHWYAFDLANIAESYKEKCYLQQRHVKREKICLSQWDFNTMTDWCQTRENMDRSQAREILYLIYERVKASKRHYARKECKSCWSREKCVTRDRPQKGINCEMAILRHNPSTYQPLLSPVVTYAYRHNKVFFV